MWMLYVVAVNLKRSERHGEMQSTPDTSQLSCRAISQHGRTEKGSRTARAATPHPASGNGPRLETCWLCVHHTALDAHTAGADLLSAVNCGLTQHDFRPADTTCPRRRLLLETLLLLRLVLAHIAIAV